MPQFWAPKDTHQSDYLDVPENDSNTAFYVGLLGFLKMVGGPGEGGGAGAGVEEQVVLRQGADDSMALMCASKCSSSTFTVAESLHTLAYSLMHIPAARSCLAMAADTRCLRYFVIACLTSTFMMPIPPAIPPTLSQGRLYRIFHLFAQLEHAMVMSQMSLMLTVRRGPHC